MISTYSYIIHCPALECLNWSLWRIRQIAITWCTAKCGLWLGCSLAISIYNWLKFCMKFLSLHVEPIIEMWTNDLNQAQIQEYCTCVRSLLCVSVGTYSPAIQSRNGLSLTRRWLCSIITVLFNSTHETYQYMPNIDYVCLMLYHPHPRFKLSTHKINSENQY